MMVEELKTDVPRFHGLYVDVQPVSPLISQRSCMSTTTEPASIPTPTHREPVGKHLISFCGTTPCQLGGVGAKKIWDCQSPAVLFSFDGVG